MKNEYPFFVGCVYCRNNKGKFFDDNTKYFFVLNKNTIYHIDTENRVTEWENREMILNNLSKGGYFKIREKELIEKCGPIPPEIQEMINNMNNSNIQLPFSVNTHGSPAIKRMFIELAREKWGKDVGNIKYWSEVCFNYKNDFYLEFDRNKDIISPRNEYRNPQIKEISIEKAIQYFQNYKEPKVIKVKLNDEYTAEISESGVKVGCQVFPLSVIDGLVGAREKVVDNMQ